MVSSIMFEATDLLLQHCSARILIQQNTLRSLGASTEGSIFEDKFQQRLHSEQRVHMTYRHFSEAPPLSLTRSKE